MAASRSKRSTADYSSKAPGAKKVKLAVPEAQEIEDIDEGNFEKLFYAC